MKRKLKKGLGEDTHFIRRGKYSTEESKVYLIVAIIVFHILPLMFVFMGEAGAIIMQTTLLYTVNVLFLFGIGTFYGIRIGYNFKFPLILTVISFMSYIIYYSSGYIFESIYYYVMTGVITFIVYALFSFFSTAFGGWAKRFF